MQREEKQLDASVEALILQAQDIKNSIGTFLGKLEHEYEIINWPTVLDNFALLSGQINTLKRLLKNEKTPNFRNYVLLPLHLSPDRDLMLEKTTEGRVPAFNHEVVPDYLRTKPEPEVEEKLTSLSNRATQNTPDNLQRQINTLNKGVNQIIETVRSTREQFEAELNQRTAQPQTSSQADTNTLIAATSFGKGLKRRSDIQNVPTPVASNTSVAPQQGYLYNPMNPTSYMGGPQQGQMNKPPGAIKTNLKSAASMHPYQR